MRRAALLLCLALSAQAACSSDPTSPARAPAPTSSGTASAAVGVPPVWATGSARDRLHALRVTDDAWARQDLFTWTRPAQVEAMRKDRVLLVATSDTRTPPSAFVRLVTDLGAGRGPAGELARLLAADPRFARRRYAWTAAYATVLGLAERRYGHELVLAHLRDDALVVAIAPEREPPVLVRDLRQREVPLAEAVRDAARIGAVYHVRTGKDVSTHFREYVLVNERALERWAVGTPDVVGEVEAEAALLSALREHAEAGAPAPRETWLEVAPTSPFAALWSATLAFPTERYAFDPRRLDALRAALGEYARGPALEVRPEPGAGGSP